MSKATKKIVAARAAYRAAIAPFEALGGYSAADWSDPRVREAEFAMHAARMNYRVLVQSRWIARLAAVAANALKAA